MTKYTKDMFLQMMKIDNKHQKKSLKKIKTRFRKSK